MIDKLAEISISGWNAKILLVVRRHYVGVGSGFFRRSGSLSVVRFRVSLHFISQAVKILRSELSGRKSTEHSSETPLRNRRTTHRISPAQASVKAGTPRPSRHGYTNTFHPRLPCVRVQSVVRCPGYGHRQHAKTRGIGEMS